MGAQPASRVNGQSMTPPSWGPGSPPGSAGPEPLTLSIAQAAGVLGIGVSTAYRLCARGEFPVPVLRIGGTSKVSARRLQAFVDGDGDAAAVGSADA
jgi:hypothetical protein